MNVFVLFCDSRLAFDSCCWFCCIDTTDGMSVATVGLALFGGCAGRLFNFELANFGTDDGFSTGVSGVSKKFDMVICDLKTSSLAGGEPVGAEQLCQLGDTCDIKLTDIGLGKKILLFRLALESLHDIR